MNRNYIDMHCDTLMAAYLADGVRADLYDIGAMVNIRKLIEGKTLAQFFAIFIVPGEYYSAHGMEQIPEEKYINDCYRLYNSNLNRYKGLMAKAENYDDIINNANRGMLSSILTMEDGVTVHGNMNRLDLYYEMGIRALALTWNYANCFGSPNSTDKKVMSKGLTDFGKDAVRHMQDIGMLVDVSHLSDGGFWDVVRICKKPFIASHSNCRSVCDNPRNLTDNQIEALGTMGGVMGLNFCPAFLNWDRHDDNSRVESLVAMAKQARKCGGIDVVAIGSDFDGIGGNLEIDGPDKMELLFDGLSKAGFSDDDIDKVAYKNVMRVIREAVR
ncbi:MAG: membrane dipeptidase [Oscillospiraceae bacterium]|nr:membrane dipeptidase [Oscillospiraceae bacterium]